MSKNGLPDNLVDDKRKRNWIKWLNYRRWIRSEGEKMREKQMIQAPCELDKTEMERRRAIVTWFICL